jgi:putative DeoR family transcriptional regulator (stage III sporulation protein D)
MSKLQELIEERTIEEAKYIINSMATIRKTARLFGVSKSTVHKDLTERLPGISINLAEEVRTLFELNFENKHIHGGEATRKKYKEIN